MSEYAVRLVAFGDGERLPLLVSSSTLLGDFEAAAFALHLRGQALKTKTIDSAIRAVQLLYEVLHEKKVSLVERARAGELLRQSEVEAISDRCKTRKEALADSSTGVISLAVARRRKGRFTRSKVESVRSKTAVIRLHYIIVFLKHFAGRARLQNLPIKKSEFNQATELTLNALRLKKPVVPKKSDRKGLPQEADVRLFEVTNVDFPGNPWKSEFVRHRNQLVVKLLYGLGIRKGELLGVKLEDINLRNGLIFIAKRTDDEDDDRGRPATTKTLSRVLPLNDEMVQLLLHYIQHVRPTRRLAGYNPYLIVSDEGNELALNGIDYLFSSLRRAFPEFVQLSAHVLRHTINDRFAKLCEGMEAPLVQLIQNYLMGWGKGSQTSQIYTKAYIEQKANEVLTALQGKVYK
ncbi:tyrosine-type recombinase/integrase [Janthinobacterium sp. ZB1P44]|uniref:tyrosine-type recombinase/integrase n=1 Tax=Janthinobacterium sp. ZB1P44 TaxID=3424192 RepID=UPI003F222EAE